MIEELKKKRIMCKIHEIPAYYFCLTPKLKNVKRLGCSECFLEGEHKGHAHIKLD